MTTNPLTPMTIVIATVPFDDHQGSKIRPALIIDPGPAFTGVLKITSEYATKSPEIRHLYYPIVAWQAAGLKHESYIDIHQIYDIATTALRDRSPIGQLEPVDLLGLRDFQQQFRKRSASSSINEATANERL